MLLGKRQRPPIRRTTSMSEFVADLEVSDEPPWQSELEIPALVPINQQGPAARQTWGDGNWTADWRSDTAASLTAMVSPRPPRKSSGDFTAVETAPFLRFCGLCNRRLAPGRDIFMYRGEIAFCSLECRQQQINHDEKKEKCRQQQINHDEKQSPTGETMAAA